METTIIMTATQQHQGSLQEIIQSWKDQIICLSPHGEGYSAYFIDRRTDEPINYIHASCDELRHIATNYNSILNKIKSQYYGYLKEAILNTVKYEATRRAFKKQHEWIHASYKILIEQQQFTAEQQTAEIKRLKAMIGEQKQEVNSIKTECRDRLEAIKAENLLKQKEAEIAAKNLEIERLNQELQQCDRTIDNLQSELNTGLKELKLKYKWLIAQFIQERAAKQQENSRNKSLQSCQNLFKKAQKQIKMLQVENKFLKQENSDLHSNTKMLNV